MSIPKTQLVSIIIPTYNCQQYIAQAIDSIRSQCYKNIEIIVIDDGSTDNSAKIAEQYGEPVKVIHQTNQGPAAARNRGVAESSGEFIAFLDGDDLWLPNKLAPQIRLLQDHPDIDIAYGAFRKWAADNNGEYPPPEQFISGGDNSELDIALSGWIYHKLLLDNYIHIITAVIRRSLFNELGGFNESFQTGEDYDFWLRASRISQAYKLAKPVALYRENPASTTRIPRETNNEYIVLEQAIKNYGLRSPDGKTITEEEMNNRLFRLNFGHGYLHFWHGSPCIAARSIKDAISYKKNNLRLLTYLILANIRCMLSSFKK